MDNNPKDSKLARSSTDEQQLHGNNNPQNAGEEDVASGSLPRPEDIVAPTQLTIGTTMTPTRLANEIGSGGDCGGSGSSSGGGRGGDQSSRKRRRSNDLGASSSRNGGVGTSIGARIAGGGGGQRGRGSRRRIDAGVPAVCAVCNRIFPSFYALFGHLRLHNKREWGGAFPPPVYNPDWVTRGSKTDKQNEQKQKQQQQETTQQVIVEQEIIPALLDAAEETLSKMKNQQEPQESRRGLRLDLNVEPKDQDSSSSSSSSSSNSQEKAETSTTQINLNLPPPKDDDEVPPNSS